MTMRLPNADQAIVDLRKLTDYCLSFTHPRGRHKAQVFASALGLTAAHAEDLRAALLAAAQQEDAYSSIRDEYGERFVVDFMVEGPAGRARVRSSWMIRTGEITPCLITCYVL